MSGETQDIVRALLDGPATTNEIASAVGVRHTRVSATLRWLMRTGAVSRSPFIVDRRGSSGPRNVWLWALTDPGNPPHVRRWRRRGTPAPSPRVPHNTRS